MQVTKYRDEEMIRAMEKEDNGIWYEINLLIYILSMCFSLYVNSMYHSLGEGREEEK